MAVSKVGVQFDRCSVVKSLDENGYAVIPNVLSITDCDLYIKEYRKWAEEVEESGIPFLSFESLIQSYRIGHFNASWQTRLKVKDVFAQIWKTDKLLTSVDAVALSYPPENGNKLFAKPNHDWLHMDQGAHRKGLHAYQGAVYLEEASELDHCFRVLEKSHKEHETFFNRFPDVADQTKAIEFYKLDEREKKWYIEEKNCKLKKVPVPKGGMVLWDSRTIHDNMKPEFGRPHNDRWRHVVFVSMTPAIWAASKDLAKKRHAYKNLLMTTHWPSVGVRIFQQSNGVPNTPTISELPDIAKTRDVKLLMGIDSFDFEDGESNGPENPIIEI